MMPKLIDRKTKKDLQVGDTFMRRNHMGFKTRWELMEIIDPATVQVRMLNKDDRHIYFSMPITSLQLDYVMED